MIELPKRDVCYICLDGQTVHVVFSKSEALGTTNKRDFLKVGERNGEFASRSLALDPKVRIRWRKDGGRKNARGTLNERRLLSKIPRPSKLSEIEEVGK